MNTDELREELEHQYALMRIQRQNLRRLELQIAQHGPIDVPLHLLAARDDLRAELARLDRSVAELRRRLRRGRG